MRQFEMNPRAMGVRQKSHSLSLHQIDGIESVDSGYKVFTLGGDTLVSGYKVFTLGVERARSGYKFFNLGVETIDSGVQQKSYR
jgi:hypothetical protein